MTHYAEELSKLKDNLLAMASHAETSVSRAMRALVERDDALARKTEVSAWLAIASRLSFSLESSSA